VPGKGRVQTKAYKEWITVAGLALAKCARQPPITPAYVKIQVGKCNQVRDLDNLCKPILDLFVKQNVIENDNIKHVKLVQIEAAFDTVEEKTVHITIGKYNDPPQIHTGR
jgi:Holliday junction resolvase RusA-like endonuclease